MDIPLISKFELRLRPGRQIRSDGKDEVFANMTGTTPAAWNDPVKGGELAKSQIDRGADIVYAAAGATGQGVLKAAADAGKLGIGVDSDQDYLFPGKVLTSMLKHVDVATYKSFMDAKNGTWKPGILALGLKEGGVDYAVDECNKSVLTPDAKAAADAAKADIISGKIEVARLHVRQQVPDVAAWTAGRGAPACPGRPRRSWLRRASSRGGDRRGDCASAIVHRREGACVNTEARSPRPRSS